MTECPVSGEDWADRMADIVAAQVRWHRDQRGMSATDLSAACTRIGYPIKRAMIQKLEARIRRYVTTAELLALSAALGVPVAALLLPVGKDDAIEITPGTKVPPGLALRWLTGETTLTGEPAAPDFGVAPIRRARDHELLVQSLRDDIETIIMCAPEPPFWAFQRAAKTHASLYAVREAMRDHDETLPRLPVDLGWIDSHRPEPDLVIRSEEDLPAGFRPGEPHPWDGYTPR